jgi:hypothetical protein
MNINILRHKLTNNLLNQLTNDVNGLFKIFVKLTNNPTDNQREILNKLGIDIEKTNVFSMVATISMISKLSKLDFVENIGIIGRPEKIQAEKN